MIPVNESDQIFLGAQGVQALTVIMKVNGLDSNGSPFTIPVQVKPGNTRAASSTTVDIQNKGAIYSATIDATDQSGTGIGPGQLLIGAFVLRNGQKVATLAQGYFYAGHNPCYPYMGGRVDPIQDVGALRIVTGTNPAANVEVSETVPTAAFWKLRMFSVVLVTDANAANRNIALIVDTATSTQRIWVASDSTNITASLTRTWMLTRGTAAPIAASATLTDTQTVLVKDCIPEGIYLREGWTFRTVTTSIQVTDNYAAPIYEVEESIIADASVA